VKRRALTDAEVIRAGHMAARRGHLDALIARIKAQPLDAEWSFALLLLGELRDGYDARASAGVEPKRGKPVTIRGRRKLIAMDYLQRRAAGGKEDADAKMVANTWGITSGRVRTIAAAYRNLAGTMTREQLDMFIAELAPKYKRITAK
jgi:hypothetical protein